MAAADIPNTISQGDNDNPTLPDERFSSASQLRDYCHQMIRADDKRTALRARVENLFNGFPSFPSGKVTEGFGWFPRVNYRELEGLISTQSTPLYDLVTEVDHLIDIELDIKAESGQQREDWQDSIEKNFTWLLLKRRRQSFNYDTLLHQREMLLHGCGHQVHISKRWTPRVPRVGKIIFPEGCPLNFHEDGKAFLLRDFIPGEDVYAAINNEKTARAQGWDTDNVWKTLVKAQKQYRLGRTTTTTSNQMLEMQRSLRRGDLGYSNTSQVGFWMNWVYVAEYEGGVSLYGIEENLSPGANATNKGYLYRKRFVEEEFPVTIFPFDIGNGEIDSVRGLGMRSKDFFELSNRMKNSMVAQVLISAFPQVKQVVPNLDPDKLKLMRIGAMSLLPYGVDYGLMQFPALNNTGLALSKELKETLGENLSMMQGTSPEPRDRETAYSFSVRAQDQARIANGLQSLYESNLQHEYELIYRLLIKTPRPPPKARINLKYQKLAQEFKDRCKRDGVPDAALTEDAIGEIFANTSSGSGSAAKRLNDLMTVWQYIYPVTSDDRKINIERDTVGNLFGRSNVDRYARNINDANMATQDDSFATQESSTLSMGGDALIGTKQDDVKHASNHLKKGMEMMQAVQQGQLDPGQALTGLRKVLDHAGQHLQNLQNNPRRQPEFQQLSDTWEQLAQFTQQLMRAVQQQQEEAAQEPQDQQSFNGEEARKDQQTAADIHRKDLKAEADISRKARKDQVGEVLADAKNAASISRMPVSRTIMGRQMGAG